MITQLVQHILALVALIRDTFNQYQDGTRKPKISLFLDDGATGKSFNDINALIQAAYNNAVTDLRGGVVPAGDTLQKLYAQIQAITGGGYATLTDVNNAVNNLINGAPGFLDQFNEIAAALGNDPNFATTFATQLSQKANVADVYDKATAELTFKKNADYNAEIGNPDTDFVAAFNSGLLP